MKNRAKSPLFLIICLWRALQRGFFAKSSTFGQKSKNKGKPEKHEKTRFSVFWPKKMGFPKRRHFGRTFDISPREKSRKKFRKKTRFQRGNYGVAQLRIMGYPGKRAPDRPWAFRRGIPPAVVYRGTPPKIGVQTPKSYFFLLFPKKPTFPGFSDICHYKSGFQDRFVRFWAHLGPDPARIGPQDPIFELETYPIVPKWRSALPK